jgi:hypothetical protein
VPIDWNDSRRIDQAAYDLVLGDFVRSLQRALINSLANGQPPYTPEEVEANQIKINCNDLTLTRTLQSARLQYTNAFLGQGRYFSAQTDMGPKHKRSLFSAIVAKEANLPYKESIDYYETMQAKFGSLCLHGIAPAVYQSQDCVMPDAIGIEDALIPGRTILGFKNMPFFMLRRTFTANELKEYTRKAKRDPGWNMPLVRRCEEWLDSEMVQMAGDNWTDLWSPEKWEERAKEDVGLCAGDEAPAIRCFDVYGYVGGDSEEESGWVRRIILDSWSTPAINGGSVSMERNKKMADKKGNDLTPSKKGDFLFTSGDRKVATNWNQIVTFQFADLSAVTPRRYHSVRGLGWMLYASCHLKNRQWCKQNEAMFEALLQYFKVKSMDDVQRAMKLELANMGIIDETITPVPAAERWQPDVGLIEYVSQVNQQVIDANAKSSTGQPGQSQGKERESNFQRMADIQQINALVSAGLNEAYQYQVFEYRENFRRLLKPNSKDPLARTFRANCMRQGVPEKLLVPEAWDIQSERMMGGGNQTLEMMIATQLMGYRPMLDPEPQRIVLRDTIMALTKNPAKALELVPETPGKTTPATVMASNAATALLNGVDAPVETGVAHEEYVGEMLTILAQRIQKGNQAGGMVDTKELAGLQAIIKNTGDHIKIMAQDKSQKEKVKKMADMLKNLANMVKAFGQRLQQAMKKKQADAAKNGNGKPSPLEQAKIATEAAKAKNKMSLAQQSHSQKTAQRQVSFEQKLKQDQQAHAAEIAKTDLETAANIHRGGMKSFHEGEE